MVYQRKLGEAIDLNAALPIIGKPQPYDYDEAIRRRWSGIDDLGNQQNQYVARKAQERQASAYQQAINAQLSGGPGTPQPGGKWISPINGYKPSFGYGAYPSGGEHNAFDIAAPGGTPIWAPYGGTIVSSKYEGDDSFGNALRIRFDNGTYGIMGHLSGFANGIKPGYKFDQGANLGYVGSTGNSTGNHLHFETRYDLYDEDTAFNSGSWFGW